MKWNELGESLKTRGQLDAIHRTKFGIAGGWKRYRECLRLGIEPKFVDHPEIETIEQHLQLMRELGNVVLTSKEKRQYVRDRIVELEKAGVEISEIVKILRDITGYSRMQLYRLIPDDIKEKYGLMVTNVTMTNKPSRKYRCDTCQYKNEVFELKNKINELNSQLMKLKSESKEQLKEEITNSQYEVEQIIALFLKKHPSKEIVNGGLIQDKLTQ
jgi:hypothetical protein